MKFVNFRIVNASNSENATEKIELGEFDDSHDLSDKASVLDFFPAEIDEPWDNIEVMPVWTDGVSCEPCEEGQESFWGVYLHQATGGVICVADLPTKEMAHAVADLIDNASKTRKQ